MKEVNFNTPERVIGKHCYAPKKCLCECGCGQFTTINKESGEQNRFILRHSLKVCRQRAKDLFDWEEFMKEQDRYDTEKEMWDDLYVKKDLGVRKISALIGPYPSASTVLKRLRTKGYTIKKLGGQYG
tara:strand:+ start:258 stop:641 length:384 start_codon:yes stop_codon:yes gene_type:complete